MDIFDALEMIGGLCLFLFGMNIMGQALERRAGSRLRTTLGKMTGKTMTGFLTGLVVTAVIQSSSATTVMVVGFVNSGLMTLKQAIGVIMGANIGTTVTAWLLSLGGISGDAGVGSASQAHVVHTGARAYRYNNVYVQQGQPQKRHRNDHAGLCDAHVRHGHHVRRGLRAARGACVQAAVRRIHQSAARRSRRRGPDRDHPVKLGLRRHSSGSGAVRTGEHTPRPSPSSWARTSAPASRR